MKSKGICCERSNAPSTTDQEHTQPKCPVCAGSSLHYRNVAGWGEQRVCSACGLIFANPLEEPEEPTRFFEKAYMGQIKFQKMDEFHKRLLSQRRYEKLQLPLALRPDRNEALNWIRERFPQGSYILDIGCGTGVFLDALRNAGFNPIGLEPSMSVVEELRSRGHTVLHGTIDDIHDDLPEVSVCTSFIVLHHIPDPLTFFRSVRRLFPKSWFLTSEATNYFKRQPYPEPPRHYTVWTAHNLEVALRKAGYDAEVIELDYMWRDFHTPFVGRLLPVAPSRRLILLYRKVRLLVWWPLTVWYWLRRRSQVRLALAYARPMSLGEPQPENS